MRWIALFLLIANTGYFLWSMAAGSVQQSVPDDMLVTDSDDIARIPTLVLLSEHLSAAQLGVKRSSGDASESSDEVDPDFEPLKEINRDDALGREEQAVAVPAVKAVNVCRELGPFEQENLAQKVLDLLKQQAVDRAVLLRRKVSEKKVYWLSLPQAEGAVRRAHIKKIEKMGLRVQDMADGRLQGKVAAGPFSSHEVAEGYLFRLLAADVRVAIEPVVDVVFQYWVQVEWMYEPGFVSPAAILHQFLLPLKSSIGKELKQNACS
ncbi:MAG: hypothetical protein P8176_02755 [Gammaproteobacteria bacterium]